MTQPTNLFSMVLPAGQPGGKMSLQISRAVQKSSYKNLYPQANGRIGQEGLMKSDVQNLLLGWFWSKIFPSHCFIQGGKNDRDSQASPNPLNSSEDSHSVQNYPPGNTSAWTAGASHTMLHLQPSFAPCVLYCSFFPFFPWFTHILADTSQCQGPLSKR